MCRPLGMVGALGELEGGRWLYLYLLVDSTDMVWGYGFQILRLSLGGNCKICCRTVNSKWNKKASQGT